MGKKCDMDDCVLKQAHAYSCPYDACVLVHIFEKSWQGKGNLNSIVHIYMTYIGLGHTNDCTEMQCIM